MTTEVTSETELDGSDLYNSLIEQAIAHAQPTLTPPPEVEEESVESKTDSDTKTEPEPDKADKTDEGLRRLTEREAAVAGKEKDLDAKLAELKRSYNANTSVDEIKKMAQTNVPGMLEKLGLNHEHVMDVLIAQKMGDKTPQALKEKLRDYDLKREIESIRQERDQERQYSQQRDYYQKVSSDAREYVTKGLDEKMAPTVSKVVKTDPDFVHQLVLRELENDAREKVARGEADKDLLTYSEAAANIEKMFSVVAKAVKQEQANQTTSKKVAVTTPTPPVTRSKDEKPKDMVKDLEEQGLKSALSLYNKLESNRRR